MIRSYLDQVLECSIQSLYHEHIKTSKESLLLCILCVTHVCPLYAKKILFKKILIKSILLHTDNIKKAKFKLIWE